jgi:hypothetical protein
VPYRYIHHAVKIRSTAKTVECFYEGKRIIAHARSYVRYGFTTLKECMPPAHLAQADWGPDRMQRWAKKIGIQTTQFIDHLIASRPFPQQAMRSCLGLLRMSERFGEDRLEKACFIALTAGATLPHSHEQADHVMPKHENIRGSKYYK